MNRRDWLMKASIAGTGLFLSRYLDAAELSRYLAEEDSGLWFKEFLKQG
jgi:hypothetical protein